MTLGRGGGKRIIRMLALTMNTVIPNQCNVRQQGKSSVLVGVGCILGAMTGDFMRKIIMIVIAIMFTSFLSGCAQLYAQDFVNQQKENETSKPNIQNQSSKIDSINPFYSKKVTKIDTEKALKYAECVYEIKEATNTDRSKDMLMELCMLLRGFHKVELQSQSE